MSGRTLTKEYRPPLVRMRKLRLWPCGQAYRLSSSLKRRLRSCFAWKRSCTGGSSVRTRPSRPYPSPSAALVPGSRTLGALRAPLSSWVRQVWAGRRRPYSVILLDEIEKAHADAFNILLQILEDGRLTDAQGRTVDFRNSIVIMTSNIGASTISKGQVLGFGESAGEGGLEYGEMKQRIMGELKKFFRPEFLNRLDEVIVFHQLTKDQIREIIELMLARLHEQLREREITLKLTEEARDFLREVGLDPAMGARPLRRAIQKHIEDALADQVLSGNIPHGSTVTIDKKDDGLITRDILKEPTEEEVLVTGEQG